MTVVTTCTSLAPPCSGNHAWRATHRASSEVAGVVAVTYPNNAIVEPRRQAMLPLLLFFVVGFPVATLATYLLTRQSLTPRQQRKSGVRGSRFLAVWGGRWDSNPRRLESQSRALPTELRPPLRPVYTLPAPQQADQPVCNAHPVAKWRPEEDSNPRPMA